MVGSLNPSIDVTMGVDCLRAGGTNRARFVREDAGGKGVNVARALKAQGVESVRLAGFVWREGGNILENALEAKRAWPATFAGWKAPRAGTSKYWMRKRRKSRK